MNNTFQNHKQKHTANDLRDPSDNTVDACFSCEVGHPGKSSRPHEIKTSTQTPNQINFDPTHPNGDFVLARWFPLPTLVCKAILRLCIRLRWVVSVCEFWAFAFVRWCGRVVPANHTCQRAIIGKTPKAYWRNQDINCGLSIASVGTI